MNYGFKLPFASMSFRNSCPSSFLGEIQPFFVQVFDPISSSIMNDSSRYMIQVSQVVPEKSNLREIWIWSQFSYNECKKKCIILHQIGDIPSFLPGEIPAYNKKVLPF